MRFGWGVSMWNRAIQLPSGYQAFCTELEKGGWCFVVLMREERAWLHKAFSAWMFFGGFFWGNFPESNSFQWVPLDFSTAACIWPVFEGLWLSDPFWYYLDPPVYLLKLKCIERSEQSHKNFGRWIICSPLKNSVMGGLLKKNFP